MRNAPTCLKTWVGRASPRAERNQSYISSGSLNPADDEESPDML